MLFTAVPFLLPRLGELSILSLACVSKNHLACRSFYFYRNYSEVLTLRKI